MKVGGTRPETLVGHENTVVLSEAIRGRMDIFLMSPRLCSSYLSARSIKMHVKQYVMKENILYGVESGDSPTERNSSDPATRDCAPTSTRLISEFGDQQT